MRVLNVVTGLTSILSTNERDSEPTWLGHGSHVIWLRGDEDGTTELWIRDAGNLSNEYVLHDLSIVRLWRKFFHSVEQHRLIRKKVRTERECLKVLFDPSK